MKGNKKVIISLLFLINIIMLVATVIPHHHHADGMICMKHDLPEQHSCPMHNHNEGSDSCCNDECLTHFVSHTPMAQADCAPHFVFIATLFTDAIISKLLLPQERHIKDYYAYKESLHGTNLSRAFGLRAPPCSFSV